MRDFQTNPDEVVRIRYCECGKTVCEAVTVSLVGTKNSLLKLTIAFFESKSVVESIVIFLL